MLAELAKIRDAGAAIRALGMRFNAGHALNYFNVQPVAALPGVRELHIGHAIVSRSVFVGMREAVRQMKALIREAAAHDQARADDCRCRAARVDVRRRAALELTAKIASGCRIRWSAASSCSRATTNRRRSLQR